MALLNRPLQLHDVRDVEALVQSTIDGSGRYVASLRPHERDDLAAYLIGVAWELSLTYNPARGRVSFSSFLGTTARLRIIDWLRKERGRSKWQFADGTYERERPQLVSLDADDSEHGDLGAALAGSSVDGGESGFTDELRALRARGRRPSRRIHPLGKGAA